MTKLKETQKGRANSALTHSGEQQACVLAAIEGFYEAKKRSKTLSHTPSREKADAKSLQIKTLFN